MRTRTKRSAPGRLAILAILVFATACAGPRHAYPGEPLPEAELAQLRIRSIETGVVESFVDGFKRGLFIRPAAEPGLRLDSVDGFTAPSGRNFLVPPGARRLTFAWHEDMHYPNQYDWETFDVTWELPRPGEYEVRPVVDELGILRLHLWNADEELAEVFAGLIPGYE